MYHDNVVERILSIRHQGYDKKEKRKKRNEQKDSKYLNIRISQACVGQKYFKITSEIVTIHKC